jgi:hypothetical protein
MSMPCPFCVQENASEALVCASCSRDISVPASLIDERDDLVRKRDAMQEELSKAKRALEEFKRGKTHRSI